MYKKIVTICSIGFLSKLAGLPPCTTQLCTDQVILIASKLAIMFVELFVDMALFLIITMLLGLMLN